MRYLFLGLFIISFLAGVVTMAINRPTDGQPGIINNLLTAVGATQREKSNRLQGASLVNGTNRRLDQAKELMDDAARAQEALMEDVADQQRLLENTNEHISYLSSLVRDFADKNNADWLRIKEATEDFNNKSRLLIESGKELVAYNKEQLKVRQQSLDDVSLEAIKSKINEGRFQQYAFESLKQRSDFINKSSSTVKAIREQTERLQDRLRSLEDNLIKKEDAQLIDNLKDMQSKSQGLLADIKLKEIRLRDLNQQQEAQVRTSQERTEDFINQSAQHLSDTQDMMRERQRVSDERVRDQIERLKEQRSR